MLPLHRITLFSFTTRTKIPSKQFTYLTTTIWNTEFQIQPGLQPFKKERL